jgi:hypothetical protein
METHEALPPFPVANPTLSFWLSQFSTDPVTSLESSPKDIVDVAIIGTALSYCYEHPESPSLTRRHYFCIFRFPGAGMSGISTAYWLSQSEDMKNASIIVLDARGISEGAQSRLS